MAEQSRKQVMDGIKEIGWTHISLTSKMYKGAVQEFESTSPFAENGKVAVLFGMHEAYLIEDEDGSLFNANDLNGGIIKSKDLDANSPENMDGVVELAVEIDGDINYKEEALTKYGLNDYAVKESLGKRLHLVSNLDQLEDLKL